MFGQSETYNLEYTWTPPTEGSAVVYYIVEVVLDGQTITAQTVDSNHIFTYEGYTPGESIKVRVAGVDAMGRQGPFSLYSDDYRDAGAPGACGKPAFNIRRT